MNYELIRIKEEMLNGAEIYYQLQGDVMVEILEYLKELNNDSLLHSDQLEDYLEINDILMPRIYKLCMEVKKKLNYLNNINYYLVNNRSSNECVHEKFKDVTPYIICLNSRLIQSMTDDEIKFVIGCEIGNLITEKACIQEIMKFIYPFDSKKEMSNLLKSKIKYWGKLTEMTSDRFGLIACGKFETAVTALFKQYSGMPFEKTDIDLEKYIKRNTVLLNDYIHNSKRNKLAFSDISIRIEGLRIFSDSDTFKGINEGRKTTADRITQMHMTELLSVYDYMDCNNELEGHMLSFIASAGLLMAGVDDQVDEAEVETIINYIAKKYNDPLKIIEKIKYMGKDEMEKMLDNSLEYIMKYDSTLKNKVYMITVLIDIAISDNIVDVREVKYLFNIATKLKIDREVFVNVFTNALKEIFVPKMRH